MDDVALVQVFAKGFRVSDRSEEFQRVVPVNARDLEPDEIDLGAISWGEITEQLYSVDATSLASEFAVLLLDSSVASVRVAHSEDRTGRKSVVVVVSSCAVEWKQDSLADRLRRSDALAKRLSEEYADTLKGAREAIQRQLTRGAFLSERGFLLADETGSHEIAWEQVAGELLRWKGVRGLGTPRLLKLGANVAFLDDGTGFELERRDGVDGVFDRALGVIVPRGSSLALWSSEAQGVETADTLLAPLEIGDETLARELASMRHAVERLSEQNREMTGLLHQMLDLLMRYWRR